MSTNDAPQHPIPAADDRMVVQFREGLRNHQAMMRMGITSLTGQYGLPRTPDIVPAPRRSIRDGFIACSQPVLHAGKPTGPFSVCIICGPPREPAAASSRANIYELPPS